MAEPTKDPWRAIHSTVIAEGAGVIAQFYQLEGMVNKEYFANARQAAAAPDLLAALEALMSEINPPTPGSIGEMRINMVYAACKAAIAKAKGGT